MGQLLSKKNNIEENNDILLNQIGSLEYDSEEEQKLEENIDFNEEDYQKKIKNNNSQELDPTSNEELVPSKELIKEYTPKGHYASIDDYYNDHPKENPSNLKDGDNLEASSMKTRGPASRDSDMYRGYKPTSRCKILDIIDNNLFMKG